ncbi:MAG: Ig-like domain-containing protein [Bacteroidota bacterium]
MNLSLKTPLLMLLSYFVAFLFFSCSRDSDLFDDYVLGDSSEDEIGAFDPDSNNQGSSGTETNTVNDTFEVVLSNSTVLDVLANDSFKSLEIAITETSEPSFGSVEINKDNTLTYTPNEGGIVEILNTSSNPPSELMDEFTYTAESKFDGIVENTSVGTVRVRILLPPREQGSPSANLLFGSGFEGSTTVNANGAVGAPNDYQYITGTDSSTGFTWSSNLIPSWRDSGSGIHTIYGGSNPQDNTK